MPISLMRLKREPRWNGRPTFYMAKLLSFYDLKHEAMQSLERR
jgi:hypothetical protein